MIRRFVVIASCVVIVMLALGELLADPPATGDPVQFRFVALDGSVVDAQALRGKVVLLDFWATWCPTCMRELPQMQALHDKYQSRGLQIVGVSLDEPADKEKLVALLERENIRWPQYFPGDGHYRNSELAKRFDVQGIPAVFLLDEQGRIVDRNVHVARLEPALRRLLARRMT